MQQYRKTETIEAVQITKDNIHELAALCGGSVATSKESGEPVYISFGSRVNGYLGRAALGEILIKRSDGSFSKCSPTTLAGDYEPVSAPSVPTKEELTKIAVTAAVDYAAPIATAPTEVIVVYADGYLAGYKKASSVASVQPQSEGGLQWVNCSVRLPHPSADPIFRFVHNKSVLLHPLEFLEENPNIKHTVEWLDESASPSTANTEEGAEQLTIADYEEAFQSHLDLVREIDRILHGDEAAKQASLCDLVGSIRDLKNASKEQQKAFAEWIPKNKFVHIFKNDGSLVWVDGDPKFPSKIRKTSELYELFITETTKQ